jgi:hypothetical protein
MKSLAAAVFASALGLFGAALVSPSDAWAQSVRIGPGGVRITPDRDRHDMRRGRGDRCRVIVEHRRNRFGERVTTRKRVCR